MRSLLSVVEPVEDPEALEGSAVEGLYAILFTGYGDLSSQGVAFFMGHWISFWAPRSALHALCCTLMGMWGFAFSGLRTGID